MVREGEQIYLVIESGKLEEAVRDLVRIGLDEIAGYFDPSMLEDYLATGGRLVPTGEVGVDEARRMLESPRVFALDVRRSSEFAEGHIPGAACIAHTRLDSRLAEVPKDRHILVNCKSGGRSARACALLQKHGYEVTNLAGGFMAWDQATAARS
jgi:hydroxyacylglutathione hydrolase